MNIDFLNTIKYSDQITIIDKPDISNTENMDLDLDIDINKIMESQPVINIGMIGHVSDGKSTITKSLTGVVTQKHSAEKQKNITIKLGYANCKIIKCNTCPKPQAFQSVASNVYNYVCKQCTGSATLINHISFVDCPGHNLLLTTMLNGTSVMDYTIIVESAGNQNIPAPQTIQHYEAATRLGLKPIAAVLNKMDLKPKNILFEQMKKIKEFAGEDMKVIPTSATFGVNMDILCELLGNLKPIRNYNSTHFKMNIIRSFNVNIPGTPLQSLVGGVVGGSILQGNVKVGETILMVPGFITQDVDDDDPTKIIKKYNPLRCTIESIISEKNQLTQAISGGLVGIGLNIDPGLATDNKLCGNVLVKQVTGSVSDNFIIKFEKFNESSPEIDVSDNTKYIVNLNSNDIECSIKSFDKDTSELNIQLTTPTYLHISDKVTLSIKQHDMFELCGTGVVTVCVVLQRI